MEAGAPSIAWSVPPPSPSPERCGGGGGGGGLGNAHDAVSAHNNAENALHTGCVYLASTVEGGRCHRRRRRRVSEGGRFSCPPTPISPKPLRLSALNAPPPPLLGRPLDPLRGGRSFPHLVQSALHPAAPC